MFESIPIDKIIHEIGSTLGSNTMLVFLLACTLWRVRSRGRGQRRKLHWPPRDPQSRRKNY